MLNHDGTVDDNDDGKGNTADGDGLLAYMAGRSSSAGDIRKVMVTKTKIPQKGKSGTGTSRKVNASKSTRSTIQVDDSTYYFYKGELIEFEGHQYFAHLTNINYWIGQLDVAGMEYALVVRGANSGVCGEYMLVVEGSERLVDVSGLAGHTVNQLRIVSAQEFATTHKGKCDCYVPSDGLAW
jgi:hypothetical protein